MTDKAVSALTSLTGANTATGDLLYIVDISEAAAADRSKKITAQELQNYLKKFPATIGVGGATPAASGAGISFPATQSASSDANTLDDYEEGTWTPSLNFTGGTTGITYSIQAGTYVKVGQLVYVRARIDLSNKGSSTGNAGIANLPFLPSGDSGGSVGYQNDCAPSNKQVIVTISNGSDNALFRYADGTTTTQVTDASFSNGSLFIFSATYRTTA